MLRLALLVALAAAPLAPAAQPTGVYLTGSLTRSQFRAEPIGQFNQTYSDFFVQRLDGAVELVPTEMTAPTFGGVGRVNLGGFALGVGYTLATERADNRSRFENGAGDRISTRTQTHAATTELTTDFLGPVVLGASFGALFRGVRVASATVYPDGSESLGTEYRLNGVYTATTTYFEGGVVGGLLLGSRLFVPVRLQVPIYQFPDRIALTDSEVYQLNSYFPRDFARFAADASGGDEREAALADRDFVGPRVQVGVEIRLF